MDFYDNMGRPVAYTDDNGHIFMFEGQPVAYLHGNSVYSFRGQHLGWFSDGWIRDERGACVLFSGAASGGPLRPLKQLKPLKGLRQLMPLKGLRQLAPLRPLNSLGWSQILGTQFFA